jgi:NAD+ kinase
MPPIRSLAFVINAQKTGASELAHALMSIAEARGIRISHTEEFPVPRGFLKGFDACCVIGGDGTLLGVVSEAAIEKVPVIGVNRGSLGFLTTFSADEVRQQFPALLEGHFKMARRSLLACSACGDQTDLALNDVLIKDEQQSRLVRLEVFADEELVTEYFCDGLIFSTPTGSTAYNLSAGGPLIHPNADVIAMTPICPHTLSNRSIIFRREVKLRVQNRGDAPRLLVALDGQRNLLTCEGSAIEISIATQELSLLQRPDYSHFSVMRAKLKWSGGYTGADRGA